MRCGSPTPGLRLPYTYNYRVHYYITVYSLTMYTKVWIAHSWTEAKLAGLQARDALLTCTTYYLASHYLHVHHATSVHQALWHETHYLLPTTSVYCTTYMCIPLLLYIRPCSMRRTTCYLLRQCIALLTCTLHYFCTSGPVAWDALLHERNELYAITLQINQKGRTTLLRQSSFDRKTRKKGDGFKGYSIDPTTRYIVSTI